MSQITKITVLNEFIKRGSISEEDIQFGRIFPNMELRTQRYMLFQGFIKELMTDGILQDHREIPKFWWTIINQQEAIAFRDKLIKDSEPIVPVVHNSMTVHGNNAGVMAQDSHGLRFEDSNFLPSQIPETAVNSTAHQGNWVSNIFNRIKSNSVKDNVIGGLILVIITWFFSWAGKLLIEWVKAHYKP